MEIKKKIEIGRAKRLEESLKFFTDPYHTDLIKGQFILTNEEGIKHEKSDELVQAVVKLNKSLKIIRNILK